MFYELWIYKSGNKKMCSKKMLQNKFFLCSVFSIPKISFAYRTTILETPKTVKSNFDIFEECRGAGRKFFRCRKKHPNLEYILISFRV